MTLQDDQTSAYPDHHHCWELLPWYVNHTLEEREHSLVEEHLRDCLSCRREIEYLEGMGRVIRDAEDFDFSPQRGLHAQLARIESSESKNRKSPHWWNFSQGPLEHYREMFLKTPPFVQRALLAQVLLIVILTGIGLWHTSSETPPQFRTLSETTPGMTQAGTTIRLVFSPEATEHAIRTLLLEFHATIVDGPSPNGVYTAVVTDNNPDLLTELRTHIEVQLAEPVFVNRHEAR